MTDKNSPKKFRNVREAYIAAWAERGIDVDICSCCLSSFHPDFLYETRISRFSRVCGECLDDLNRRRSTVRDYDG